MSAFTFPRERVRASQVFTFPEAGRVVEENPVCLCWIPMDGKHTYTVTVTRGGAEVFRAETAFNYAVAELPGAGEYAWNVFAEGEERGAISFTLAEYAVTVPRVDAATLLAGVPDVHPRHLFCREDIPEIVRTHEAELRVLRRNIEQAYKDGIPQMPMYHRDPDALPYREFFGRYRDFVDRNLVALSLGWALLGDEKAGAFAKEILLTICDRNPHGPCSVQGPWGDEVGLSMTRCLPAVYDLLWDRLDDKERKYIAYTIRTYATQSYELLKNLDYCQNPGSSHAGRQPAYLGEAALVLKGSGVISEEELLNWLGYSLEIYGGIFPYYGTPDGGWAEGAFYSTSYTKWYLPFFSAVERFGGTRFLDRPFYQKLPHYFVHFANPAQENHPFGDGYWCHPEDAEWPGFFAQSPCRFYAERFGPEAARKMVRDTAEPELYLLHLLDIFLPAGKPSSGALLHEAEDTAVFPDAGFVSMHTNLGGEDDVAVLARASKFGGESHRHADQGGFALYYRGAALLSPSGYFGRAYGTKHHFGWLRQTVAHNCLLVDGEGQAMSGLISQAKIVSVTDDGTTKTALLDLTTAYPMLTKCMRTLTLSGKVLTVTDEVEADHAVTLTLPLHTLSAPIEADGKVLVEHNGAHLTITPDAKAALREISDKFGVDLNEGVPEAFHAVMPPQWHVYFDVPAAERHAVTMTYTVE